MSLPKNISYTLVDGWTTENISINYDGVSYQKDRIINGSFTSNANGWGNHSDDPGELIINGWQSGDFVEIELDTQGKTADTYAYYEQNINIPEILTSEKLATLSLDYYYLKGGPTVPDNISIYYSIIINGVEVNNSILLNNLADSLWTSVSLTYDINSEGQVLPNNATVRLGVYVDDNAAYIQASSHFLRFDNVKYKIWTKPNASSIVNAMDLEDMSNYSYYNTSNGEGYSFIDIKKSYNETKDVKFTISPNVTGIEDFEIYNITISSYVTKEFNSTISSSLGTMYETGDTINWTAQCFFNQPFTYLNNWGEIEKPADWVVTHIYDSYEVDKIGSCTGIELGSTNIVIPESIYSPGLWEIEAYSQNYVDDGYLGLWNGSAFECSTKVTIDDVFHINVTLNDTISLTNTQVNSTIKYPNSTIFWQGNQAPSSFDVSFGNFTVGNNMSVGMYDVIIEWTNNLSATSRDKIGYINYQFEVWHSTNLSAVNSYIEAMVGDPVLVKVIYMDYDFDTYIQLATITYNSTFGQSGTMSYIGSGVYILDLDTSGLALGDYYFSFNASKDHYENQTRIDLIHLKMITQPLDLDVPLTTINSVGNSRAVCQVNVTGAISGGLIWPANISTNWQKNYTVTKHFNGTYTLNFSTEDLPTGGLLENFVITVYANKTNYGSTSDFITLSIEPIATNGSVNETLVNAYKNEAFDLKVNYTLNGTSTLISGATCTVIWAESSTITPVSDEFIVNLDTSGLLLGVHQALIKLEKPGYETIYKSITVLIQEQQVNLTISLNGHQVVENTLINLYYKDTINVSGRAFALGEEIYISGGNFSWISENYHEDLTEAPSTYYNSTVVMDAANFTAGINYIYLRFEKENYSIELFSFQAFVSEQNVNLTVVVNSQQIVENTLFNHYFKEVINVSVRAYAEIEQIYLTGGVVTWASENYVENLTESPITCYNISITINAMNFSAGINYIYLKFQQANYTTKLFSFQLFISEQNVNLTVVVNSQQIVENTLFNHYFKEVINVSVRAYAEIEQIYLTGGVVTWTSENYVENLTESLITCYNISITINAMNFSAGINYIYLKFQQANYTTKLFSFQLFIRAQPINLTLYVDSVPTQENVLVEKSFNDNITLSCRAYAEVEKKFLTGGNFSFNVGSNVFILPKVAPSWFNLTVKITTINFSIDVNSVSVKFEQINYTTTIFSFQIQVQKLKMNPQPYNFQGVLEGYVGEVVKVKIKLLEEDSTSVITGALVKYSWDYGVGDFIEQGNGIYEVSLELPPGLEGTFQLNLIITKTGGVYQAMEYPINIRISQREAPPLLLWIIIIAMIAIISVLGVMSLRAYVILPRARKKESELLLKTQKFKDIRNIQAILVIHRQKSLPILSETFTFLTDTDPQLFSGFIQALTMTGREIAAKESKELKEKVHKMSEEMMEFDFKYFQMLLYDYEYLRIVLILKEPSSERLKNLIKELAIELHEKLGDSFENFAGIIDPLRKPIQEILYKGLDLSYKESFKLTEDKKFLNNIISSGNLSKMETRIINVLIAHFKNQDSIFLEEITSIVSEKNENIIIIAIESLLQRKILIQKLA